MIILIIDAHIIISPSYQYYRDYNIKNGPWFVRRRGRQGCCGLFIFFFVFRCLDAAATFPARTAVAGESNACANAITRYQHVIAKSPPRASERPDPNDCGSYHRIAPASSR